MADGTLKGLSDELERALAVVRELESAEAGGGEPEAARHTTETIAILDRAAARLRTWQEEQVVAEGPSPRAGGPPSPVEGAGERDPERPAPA